MRHRLGGWSRTLAAALVPCAVLALSRSAGAVPRGVPHPPPLQAKSAILVDAVSGQVLYERDADVVRPPASTTKIMTALMLLENTQPTDVLRASKKASEVEGSSLYMKPGETVSARDMLFALLLRSANDGCVTVAEHVSGSEKAFAARMTARAQELGAVQTVFRNASGLNEPANETTARDLATLTRYAVRFPDFNEATRSRTRVIERSISKTDTLLKNHALPFLKQCVGADGIKTGYTRPAGKCFVGSCTRDGWRLIAVVLNSPDAMVEAASLLDYGYRAYQLQVVAPAGQEFGPVPVEGGASDAVQAVARAPVTVAVRPGGSDAVTLRPRLAPLRAPVAANAQVGVLEAWRGSQMAAAFPLYAAEEVPPAGAVQAATGAGRWLLLGAVGSVVLIYGRTAAKTARGRRGRLA